MQISDKKFYKELRLFLIAVLVFPPIAMFLFPVVFFLIAGL